VNASAVVVRAACVAVLASVLGSAWVGIPKLDDWRTRYGPLTPELRDDPVALFLGFDVESWDALQRALGERERYLVVAQGPTRFEVRNYAAYALLPAIQVATQEDADVVVYYGTAASEASCTRIAAEVCIRRRERS
jgi:hypothetical protein